MTDKLKILYTIPNFDTAGSGKVLYDLAKGLDPNYFEVSIACKHDKGEFFKTIESLNLPIYFIDPTVPLRPYYNFIFRLNPFKKIIKAQQFDIVHSWHWSSDWTEVLACRLGGAKFVYTKKAMSWSTIHWNIRSFLSNFIITVNEDMQHYFPYKKNQKLIPFGLDTAYFSPEKYKKKPNESLFKIITVANLVEVKGIEVLIKALKLCGHSNFYLDILGDDSGAYADVLKALVKDLKLENQVVFLGKHSDVRPYLAQSDLYVIPSRKEGMPMALIEAMAMGIPVLGSDISGINFVLKDFPELLFKGSNIKILSDKIESFYKKSNTERIDIGKQLRDYCVSYFSMSAFIKAHEDLYIKLAKK